MWLTPEVTSARRLAEPLPSVLSSPQQGDAGSEDPEAQQSAEYWASR
jgi:hypothetical protein